MSDWIVKTTGIISQVYPFQCGGDDVTRSQRKDVCGSAINPFNPNLFDEVDESSAEASWHEMMEDVKLSHADFKTTVAPPSDKPKEIVVKFVKNLWLSWLKMLFYYWSKVAHFK